MIEKEKKTVLKEGALTRQRNQTLDILKGVGIILMVIGHSGAPIWLHNTIYSFHMPLFFIASGWFFSEKDLDKPVDYIKRKIKGIYWPYLKWSIVFLLLHNILFSLGVINEKYSNQTAYDMNVFVKKLCNVVFFMRDFDQLVATYWFLRCLFVGCLAFCLCSSLVHKTLRVDKESCVQIVCLCFLILCGTIAYFQLKIPIVPNNGYRELLAAFFVGMGCLIKKNESALSKYRLLIITVTPIFIILPVLIHPIEMFPEISFKDWLLIPIAGVSGFLLVYQISKLLSSGRSVLIQMLIYIGRRTFYILTFHFLMFKPASYLKTCMLGLDWHAIGCFPVISSKDYIWYWIVYTISTIVFSLMLERLVSHFKLKPLWKRFF